MPSIHTKSNARTLWAEIKISIDSLASMRSINGMEAVPDYGTLYESGVNSGSKINSRNK
jgi:hypothetical protein